MAQITAVGFDPQVLRDVRQREVDGVPPGLTSRGCSRQSQCPFTRGSCPKADLPLPVQLRTFWLTYPMSETGPSVLERPLSSADALLQRSCERNGNMLASN